MLGLKQEFTTKEIKERLTNPSQEVKDAMVEKELADYLKFFPLLSKRDRNKKGIETYLKNVFTIFCIYMPVLAGFVLITVGAGFYLGFLGIAVVAFLNYLSLRFLFSRNVFFARGDLGFMRDKDLVLEVFEAFISSKFANGLSSQYKEQKMDEVEHYLNGKENKAVMIEMRDLVEAMLELQEKSH